MSDEKPKAQESPPKKDAGQIFIEEVTEGPGRQSAGWRRILNVIAVPVLAIFTGLVLGAVVIIFTNLALYEALRVSIPEGLRVAWESVVVAYGALFTGAFGSPQEIVAAISSGDSAAVRQAFYPFFESLVAATPYIFGGLSVALGFRVGLFNIGAEGQLFMGAIFATYVGYSITGLPPSRARP